MTKDKIRQIYLINIRPWLGLALLYKILAWVIVLILSLSAAYRLLTDSGIINEITSDGWFSLFSEEYFRDLFFSPLWIVAGFLFNLADKREAQQIRRQKSDVLAFLKNKQSVNALDVLDFLHGGYNPLEDYHNRTDKRDEVIQDSEDIDDEKLKL